MWHYDDDGKIDHIQRYLDLCFFAYYTYWKFGSLEGEGIN